MALGTYSDLETALSAWLDGSPFDGREGDFISLCEDEINVRLAAGVASGRDIRPMVTTSPLTIDAELVTPTGFAISDMLLPISLMVTGQERPWQIDYVSPQNLSDMRYGTRQEREGVYLETLTYTPRYYTILGGQFQFLAPPQSPESFTADFTYYAKLAALSDAAPTNWLLTSHKNAYLYGSLAQASMFGWNDKGMSNWAALFEQAMDGVLSRYPVPANNAPLRSELVDFGRRGYSYASFMSGAI